MRIDSDIAAGNVQTEILEKRMDGLSTRSIVLSVLMSGIFGAGLFFGYLHLQRQVDEIRMSGTNQVTSLNHELDQKLFQLSARAEELVDRIRENQKAVDGMTRKLDQKVRNSGERSKSLEGQLAKLSLLTERLKKTQAADQKAVQAIAGDLEATAKALTAETENRRIQFEKTAKETAAIVKEMAAVNSRMETLSKTVEGRVVREDILRETDRLAKKSDAARRKLEARINKKLKALHVSLDAAIQKSSAPGKGPATKPEPAVKTPPAQDITEQDLRE